MKKILVVLMFFTTYLTNGQDGFYLNNYLVGKPANIYVEVHMFIVPGGARIYLGTKSDSAWINRFSGSLVKQVIKNKVASAATTGQIDSIYNDLNEFFYNYLNPVQINGVTIYPPSHNDTAEFGDRLEVRGKNFSALIHKANNDNPIVLYLDNYKLKSIKGSAVDDTIMYFTLDATLNATNEDKNFWTSEYNASLKAHGLITPVLKIGTLDGSITSTPFKKFSFRIYNHMRKVCLWVFFVISFILLILAAWKTDLLRETCECKCSDIKKTGRRPFSLSRTQMAFWTIIVAFSFTYIYLITGEMPDITNGTLVLLGISSSTTLGGYLLDTNDPTSKSKNAPVDRCCSKGFPNDILSDGGIPGIHRLQNVLFTGILGIIYLSQAVNDLNLTEFNANLLILMGISSGTYLGVKYFANQKLAQNATKEQQQPIVNTNVAPKAATPSITLKNPTPLTVTKGKSLDLEFVTAPLNIPVKFTCVGDNPNTFAPKLNATNIYTYTPAAVANTNVTVTATLVSNPAISTKFNIKVN